MFQNQKASWMKHQQIDATISQVSMFHKFLYIIAVSLKHLQIVFGTQSRERKNMLISRQVYTSPVSGSSQLAACRDMPDSGDRVREY